MSKYDPEYQRAYRKANAGRLKEYFRERHKRDRHDPQWVMQTRKRGREYWRALRQEIMAAYGGAVCKCCGERNELFLTIDHVNNDGAEHRRSLGYDGNGKGASTRTLGWIKKHDFPNGFQVLCMNCNLGKQRNNGICPHEATPQRQPREFGERLIEIIPSRAATGGRCND